MIRLRGVRVDHCNQLMSVRLLKIPGNYCLPVVVMASGRTYFTCSSVILGLMVMSYFGRVTERCSRVLYGFISLAETRTPSGFSPWSRFTVGCNPFQVIRRAHWRTTFSPFSNTPFHFFSNVDQHRSIRLYLLWYGG